MNVDSEIPIVAQSRLPGVQAHPHFHLFAVRPHVRRERALDSDRSRGRRTRAGKRREQLIAARVDLASTCSDDRVTHNPSLILEHRTVALSEPLQQPRRSFYVREEKGDRPIREVEHRSSLRLEDADSCQ